MTRFSEFVSSRVGHNWAVVKRRTPKLRQRYGTLLLPREYKALEAEYERQFGMHPMSALYREALRAA